MFTLIENGTLYAPEPRGRVSILLADSKIAKIGGLDGRALETLGVDYDVIDASHCIVTPGLIDPHEHISGGSGERGFSTQTPEIELGELVSAGITTVVGALGVDTTMKTMAGLLAKAKALKEEGLTAFIWSGGYTVPPSTITPSVRDDILFIDEVIGAGEIAIADKRSMEPQAHELARIASDAYVGGMLSRKAGLTHLHVGEGEGRLEVLRRMIDEFEIEPAWLYPTHIERSEALMEEAIELTKRGAFVDIDTVEEDLPQWLGFYLDHGGDLDQLTVSSDTSVSSPRTLFDQICVCILEHHFPLEQVLPLVTLNTARVLKLPTKGKLQVGCDADVLVLRENSFELVEVIANGQRLMKNGDLVKAENFLKDSNRTITLTGEKRK
jgi:beta-aspartyl-dipeptidase (metallo-type)